MFRTEQSRDQEYTIQVIQDKFNTTLAGRAANLTTPPVHKKVIPAPVTHTHSSVPKTIILAPVTHTLTSSITNTNSLSLHTTKAHTLSSHTATPSHSPPTHTSQMHSLQSNITALPDSHTGTNSQSSTPLQTSSFTSSTISTSSTTLNESGKTRLPQPEHSYGKVSKKEKPSDPGADFFSFMKSRNFLVTEEQIKTEKMRQKSEQLRALYYETKLKLLNPAPCKVEKSGKNENSDRGVKTIVLGVYFLNGRFECSILTKFLIFDLLGIFKIYTTDKRGTIYK